MELPEQLNQNEILTAIFPKKIEQVCISSQALTQKDTPAPYLLGLPSSTVTHSCKASFGGWRGVKTRILQVRRQTRVHRKTLPETCKIDKPINEKELKSVFIPQMHQMS